MIKTDDSKLRRSHDLLEEVPAWLLRSSGFEVLTADDKDKEPWKS
ncbi:hypothetical protein O1L68_00170 [Streptomyces lydicus]|nr:hypothetical protein [Streptomyces lydicus]